MVFRKLRRFFKLGIQIVKAFHVALNCGHLNFSAPRSSVNSLWPNLVPTSSEIDTVNNRFLKSPNDPFSTGSRCAFSILET